LVLIEIYDGAPATDGSAPQLANISARGVIERGGLPVLAGFVVAGDVPKRVLIRAIGPALTGFGVTDAIADPVLSVQTPAGEVIARNDNWQTATPINGAQFAASATEVVRASGSIGAFPLPAGSRDAALVITLAPGAYTAAVSGVGDATGAALVEVYLLPE
jgi:hypothetical protein